MKIAIGTNYFGEYGRQSRAKECLIRLRRMYLDVSLYDVCFTDETHTHTADINVLNKLTRSSRDMFPNSKKRLPYINDIFKALSEVDADYFIYTNSDVLIRPTLIQYIKNNPQIRAMPCNRLDIQPINTLNDNIIPYRWEIGGFDTFVFNTNWFKSNSHYFEDFLMGSIWFDHHYAGIMKTLTNDKLGNIYPPFLLHEMHNKNWSYDDPEAKYNNNMWTSCKYQFLSKPWDDYFASYLKDKRQNGFTLHCDNDEIAKEIEFFDKARLSLKI